jgi:hypothetical protein
MPRLPFFGRAAVTPAAYPTTYPQAGPSHAPAYAGPAYHFLPYSTHAPSHEVVTTGKRGRAPDDVLKAAGANWCRRYN